jgi:hypothetical protein
LCNYHEFPQALVHISVKSLDFFSENC